MGTDVSAGVATATESAAYHAQDASSHVCGQEQIFSPVTVRKGGGGGSFGFESPDGGDGGPFTGHVGATANELSPYFTQFLGDDGTTCMKETDFQLVANDTGTEINIRKTNRANISRVQTTGLRGPLMLSGWGTDLADRPVPQGGTVFDLDTDAVGDRTKWKTGPVNLMWDYQRKVWSGGPQIVMGIATGKISAPSSPCSPTSFNMDIFRIDQQTGGGDSNCHLEETIKVHNFDVSLSQEDVPGYVFVVAVRLNYKWVPIWVGCPEYNDYVTTDEDGNRKWIKAGDCFCADGEAGADDDEGPDPDDPDDPGDDDPGMPDPPVDPPDWDDPGVEDPNFDAF
jgi:hypothetical protein